MFSYNMKNSMKQGTFILKNSALIMSDFKELNNQSKLKILLGEGDRAYLAAHYISACHNLKDSE